MRHSVNRCNPSGRLYCSRLSCWVAIPGPQSIGVSPKIIMTMVLNILTLPGTLIALDKLYRKHQRHLQRRPQLKDPAADSLRASQHTLACLFAHTLRHVRVQSFEKKEWNKVQAPDWEAGNEGLCSCFSGSVHCSDSGDKNVACVSLRALACLQNASVLWSRHRPAAGGGGGGEWREEHGALRREGGGLEGTAAVWASSLLARLLKVIIEFLCRASPPCGILLCAHYEADGEQGRGRKKSWQRPMPLCSDLICNK